MARAFFIGPCIIYWPVHYLLARAFFTGPCIIYWPVHYLLARAFFTGPCFYCWSVHYLSPTLALNNDDIVVEKSISWQKKPLCTCASETLNGLPWSRPLYFLFKYYFPLYEKLREEQFIPDDLHSVLSTLSFGKPSYNILHQRLHTLTDPFIVDLSHKWYYLFVVTEQGMEMIYIRTFFDYRERCNAAFYTGAHLQIVIFC